MIYAKRIVHGSTDFRGHFQDTPNLKTFFGYAGRLYKTQSMKIPIHLGCMRKNCNFYAILFYRTKYTFIYTTGINCYKKSCSSK